MRFLLLVLLLLPALAGATGKPPLAVNGLLDLSRETFDDGPIRITGEWQLARGELVPIGEPGPFAPVPVPGPWPDDNTLPVASFGVGTYDLTIRLPPTGGPYAIRTGRTYAASHIFVNGVHVGESGHVADHAEAEIPSLQPRVVQVPLGAEEVHLRVWVSNFHAAEGGMRRAWRVGPSSEVLRQTARDVLGATILVSFLGVVALLFLVLWAAERRNHDKLWFAAVSFVTALRTLVGDDAHLVYLLAPNTDWPSLVRIEYVSNFLAPGLGIALMTRLYPKSTPRKLAAAIQMVCVAIALVCAFLPSHILGTFVPLVAVAVFSGGGMVLLILVRATFARAPQAALLLSAVTVTMACALRDVAGGLGLIRVDHELLGIGFSALVLAQAYVLARLVAESVVRIEKLSAAIQDAHEVLKKTHSAVVRFVPFEFLDLLGKSSIVEVQRGDHVEMEVEVLFCDVRGYTTLVEGLTPSAAFGLVNDWLSRMEPHIHDRGGFIKEYLGDCIVALFPSSADAAVAACVAMQATLREFDETQEHAPGRRFSAGMGLHAGPLVMGTIGGDTRLDTGAIGDCVNTASRVEGLTRVYGAQVILTETVRRRLQNPDAFSLRELDEVTVKGRVQPLRIYEVLDALPEEVRSQRERARGDYYAGLKALRAGDLDAARRHFEAVLAVDSEDAAARVLWGRCQAAS